MQAICRSLKNLLGLLLLAAFLNLTVPGVSFAEKSDSIAITGDGITTPVTLTLAQLQAMEQYQHVYSVINTWPTKKWYVAEGIKLRDLFSLAGIKEEATLVKFISNDGFEVTLTVQELLKDKRYYFPHFMDNHPTDGTIPGSPADAEEVEPILALVSAEDSNNPDNMNDRDALLLVTGQRVVSEQTNSLFLKYVNKIEVLTTPPQKWDNPKADIDSGEVPAGAQVKLSNKRNDVDKIYYTTDGSTPDLNSPMFNKSSSRWWPLRPDDLASVNQPIQIDKDTVIKAITIGPGKLNSDVVTFTYKADFSGRAAAQAGLPGGPPTAVTLDQNSVSLDIGSTVELAATVGPGNAIDKGVIWSSSDTSVATVDNSGLVTVVGPGTAVITVRTVVGNITAACVVNGPDQAQDGNGQIAAANGAGPQAPEAQEEESESPVPEPAELSLAETELAAEEPDKSGEAQEQPVPLTPETVEQAPAETDLAAEEPKSADEPEPPVENGQYLAEKEALAGSTTPKVSSETADSQPVQVFEMLIDGAPAEMPLEQKILDIYAAGALIILFLFGAGRKYMEYTREATR